MARPLPPVHVTMNDRTNWMLRLKVRVGPPGRGVACPFPGTSTISLCPLQVRVGPPGKASLRLFQRVPLYNTICRHSAAVAPASPVPRLAHPYTHIKPTHPPTHIPTHPPTHPPLPHSSVGPEAQARRRRGHRGRDDGEVRGGASGGVTRHASRDRADASRPAPPRPHHSVPPRPVPSRPAPPHLITRCACARRRQVRSICAEFLSTATADAVVILSENFVPKYHKTIPVAQEIEVKGRARYSGRGHDAGDELMLDPDDESTKASEPKVGGGWPAWKCSRPPLHRSHPGTPTPSWTCRPRSG